MCLGLSRSKGEAKARLNEARRIVSDEAEGKVLTDGQRPLVKERRCTSHHCREGGCSVLLSALINREDWKSRQLDFLPII